ncbi:hypothetical protein PIB30_074670 [Stylosanthes scabra]|uniref:DUF4219 domain-containing protein n=1 Tax=Stylosanthes scabra TaxID=79078 RepID=A0ABU6XNA7_9FABA|nr:hypothetical protein [Stylosanthes scabra]
MASTSFSNNNNEGISITRPPIFDGVNFSYWKNRMMIWICSQDSRIWDVIEEGNYIPTKKTTQKVDGKDVEKENIFKLLERKELQENQRRINAQLTTLQLSVLRFVIQSANSNFNNSLIATQPLNSEDLPSQALLIPRGSIPTLFLCDNQEGREDALLNEEGVENLNHKELHECLEEVEEENEDQGAEDVDHEVEEKDKEQKGMEVVHFASSEATPSKPPSELQFEWVNFSNLNFIGPQHYGLLETDGQLKALCGVMDKKEMDSLWLYESRFITCGKPKIRSRHLLKLHNNRGKVGVFSLWKHLEPCQFQEKLVDSQSDG